MGNPPFNLMQAADVTAVAPPRGPRPLELLRLIFEKAQGGLAQGVPLDQVNAYVKKVSNQSDIDALAREIARRERIELRDLGRAAGMGATLNFLPELMRAAGSGLITSPGQPGLPPDPNPAAAGEALRARHEEFTADHPAASMAASAAGGIAGPGLATLPLVGGASVPMAAMRTGALGMAEGAIAGAGAAGPGRRLEGAVPGAVVGGGVGTVLGGIGGAIAQRGATPGARRVAEAVDVGGEAGLLGAAAEAARAGRGGDIIAADLSDALRRELDFAVRANPNVQARVTPMLEARGAETAERMGAQARGLLGGRPSASAQEAALDAVRREAGRAINAIPDQPLVDPRIDELLKRPVIEGAFERSKELREMAAQAKIEPTFSTVNHIRQRLEAMAEQGFGPGGDKMAARLYADTAKEIDDLLDELVPEYRARQNDYRLAMDNIRAAEEGLDWLHRQNADGLRATWNAFTPAQQTAFRTRLAAGLLDDLENARTNADLAARFIRGGKGEQVKLEIIFGSRQNMERFMEGAQVEGAMRRTRPGAGSPTHAAEAFADLGPEGLVRPSGIWDAILNRIQNLGRKKRLRRANAAVAAEMEPLLAQPVGDVDMWLRGVRAGAPRGAGVAPAGVGAIGSLLDAWYEP